MNNLSVEIVTGSEALTELRPEWQALFKMTSASPFLSWEWMKTWSHWFGKEKNPHVLCARENGKLIGLLPLGEDEVRSSPLSPKAKRLSFLGEPQGAPDYHDILSVPGSEQKCADAIFSKLVEGDSFDLLVLEGMLADSPSLPLLALRFDSRRGFKYQLTPQYACPQMELDVDSEDVLKGMQRREYFNRALRRLNKLPGFEMRTVSDPREMNAASERFLELHDDRWKDRGGSAATSSSEARGFMCDVACKLAEVGMMKFEELWFEGGCRASIFGMEAGSSYYFYLSGFDQAYTKLSPSFVLGGLSIRGAAQRGLKRYDFLRGAEPYKFNWANRTALTVSAEVVGNSQAARWFMAQNSAKEIAQSLVPERIKALRRRIRRSLKPTPAEEQTAKPNPDHVVKPEEVAQT